MGQEGLAQDGHRRHARGVGVGHAAGRCRAQPTSRPLERAHAGARCPIVPMAWQGSAGSLCCLAHMQPVAKCMCAARLLQCAPAPERVDLCCGCAQDKYGLDVSEFGYDPTTQRQLPPGNSPERPPPAQQSSRYCTIM